MHCCFLLSLPFLLDSSCFLLSLPFLLDSDLKRFPSARLFLHSQTGVSDLSRNWARFAANGTNLGLFMINFQVSFQFSTETNL